MAMENVGQQGGGGAAPDSVSAAGARPGAAAAVEEDADLANDAVSAEDDPDPVAEKLSGLVTSVIQQTQTVMEELLPAIANINTTYVEVTEEFQHARDFAVAKKARLEEEKEKFQQAACSVLDLLSALN
ncbi:uncharacterized protein LOC112344361 [Selaginella moellendorffii]|uniref:uncharacterized protein LOC112344361 n=1 Tax=Selaginella moellendorffii TaxID=88036 RepID=UPI000D1CF1A3|nr:uncharacterized protein LOC112344361 [Selaginella moellendorffii]|eukprot:XP_024524699.1 uncharacterized protein LOC112344361 [Selaginella moellendorffii]